MVFIPKENAMIPMTALRYFIETVRLQSFTAAAQSLGVSQSTVSKMIKNLEMELGEPVIVRSTKPLLLSDIGRVLYEKGPAVLESLQRLEQDVHAVQALRKGVLRIGIPPMINVLFTDVMKQFKEQHTQIQLHIVEQPGPAIEQMVAADELDLGFSIAPINQQISLASQILVSHEVYAVGHSELLRRSSDQIRFEQLVNQPLLLLNDEFGITRLVRQAFAKKQLQPTIYAQSSQWDWVLSMAQAGLGIALLPEPFCSRIPSDMVSTPIRLPESLKWEVVLLWNGCYLSQAAQAWLELCGQPLGGDWRSGYEEKI